MKTQAPEFNPVTTANGLIDWELHLLGSMLVDGARALRQWDLKALLPGHFSTHHRAAVYQLFLADHDFARTLDRQKRIQTLQKYPAFSDLADPGAFLDSLMAGCCPAGHQCVSLVAHAYHQRSHLSRTTRRTALLPFLDDYLQLPVAQTDPSRAGNPGVPLQEKRPVPPGLKDENIFHAIQYHALSLLNETAPCLKELKTVLLTALQIRREAFKLWKSAQLRAKRRKNPPPTQPWSVSHLDEMIAEQVRHRSQAFVYPRGQNLKAMKIMLDLLHKIRSQEALENDFLARLAETSDKSKPATAPATPSSEVASTPPSSTAASGFPLAEENSILHFQFPMSENCAPPLSSFA